MMALWCRRRLVAWSVRKGLSEEGLKKNICLIVFTKAMSWIERLISHLPYQGSVPSSEKIRHMAPVLRGSY